MISKAFKKNEIDGKLHFIQIPFSWKMSLSAYFSCKIYYSRMLAGQRHSVCISLPNTIKTKRIKQQRPEWPTVTLTWHACKYKVHKLHQMYILCLWFTYLVFTRMPVELPWATQVFVVVLVLRTSSVN